MEKQQRDLVEELRCACREASDEGLTVAQIDELPHVDALIRQTYRVTDLIKVGRHTKIRSFLQDEVDEQGVRQRIATFQPTLPGLDSDAVREPRDHSAIYMHRDEVLAEPALSMAAILKVRTLLCGIVRKTPLLPMDARLQLLTEIDAAFDRLMGRSA